MFYIAYNEKSFGVFSSYQNAAEKREVFVDLHITVMEDYHSACREVILRYNSLQNVNCKEALMDINRNLKTDWLYHRTRLIQDNLLENDSFCNTYAEEKICFNATMKEEYKC